MTYYFGVPLLLAFYSSLEVWRHIDTTPFRATLTFYMGHAFVPWWLACAMTQLVKVTLKPWKPNPWIIMLLGVGITVVLSLPYGQMLDAYYVAEIGPRSFSGNASALATPADMNLWSKAIQPVVIWIGINYFFDRALDFPRYRYEGAHIPAVSRSTVANQTEPTAESIVDTAEMSAARPRFLDHIPHTTNLDDIFAITAEQHYIRVYARDQDHMILYRFSDAVAEIGKFSRGVGLQVHRSFWVRKDAIQHIESENKKMFVRLTSGLQVPVSQPYRALVNQIFES